MLIVTLLRGPVETLRAIEEKLSSRGHRVLTTESSLADAPQLAAADVVIVDVELGSSGLVEQLATSSPGIEVVLVGPRTGFTHPDVIDHLERPIDIARLATIVDELAEARDREKLREPIELVAYETLFAGDSPQIRDLLRRVRLIARSDAPAWVFGDDGSGRAVIARAIHDRSARRSHPFVAINCGAYGDEELARRLFVGDDAAVAAARNGSLFIERITMSGGHTQRELVRYLEANHDPVASPRLIVGMQRDKAVGGAQHFVSAELFYRLKVHELEIPRLEERAPDLERIVGCMLQRLASDGRQAEIANEAMRLLERYSFPGNLLELAHALTHAYVLATGGRIQPQHLPMTIRKATAEGDQVRAVDGELEALDVVAKRFERDYLLRVLRSVDGNRGRAAEVLGLSRKGLWGKLKAHGISDDELQDDDAT